MILECLRLTREWLDDADLGVNELLTGMPRDGGDAAPTPVTLVDETTTGWVARRQIVRDIAKGGPFIAVAQLEDANVSVSMPSSAKAWADGEVTVVAQYVFAAVDSEAGTAAAHYTLRAVRGSLHLLQAAIATAARERNGVRITAATDIRSVPVTASLEDQVIAGGIAITFRAQEVLPVRATP